MSENVSEQEEASSLTILQEVVINEVEEVEDDGKRLGIYPVRRRMLGVSHRALEN